MSKERVIAGIKILGVYFLFVASEKFMALVSSLILFRAESRQFSAIPGQPQTSLMQALAARQTISLILVSLFYFLAAYLCIKNTDGIARICGVSDSNT